MIGERFGRLLVIERSTKTDKSKNSYWICQCDCGNITNPIYRGSLLKGKSKSCGCLNKELASKRQFINLKDQIFGKLSVTNIFYKKERDYYWECTCQCGNRLLVLAESLRSGHTKSCGCLKSIRCSESNLRDLTNNVYGILKVLERNGKDKHGHVMWKCICNCGTVVICNSTNLIRNKTLSCGCRKRGNQTHGTIYGIYDKDKNLVYVGKTIKYNIQDRLKGHILNGASKMKKWLSTIDYIPNILPIEINVPILDLTIKEKQWIAYYRPHLNTQNN